MSLYEWERCNHKGIGQIGCPTCDPDKARVTLRLQHLDNKQLRAELAASESLVTALQAELAATAQRAVESVREAREEQREACAADIGTGATLNGEWYAQRVRATPLDATPLRERIAELEADVAEGENYLHESTLQVRLLEAERDAARTILDALQVVTEKTEAERDALKALGDTYAKKLAMVADYDALKAQVERLTAALERQVWQVFGTLSRCLLCDTRTEGPHVAEKFTHPHRPTCVLFQDKP